MNTEVLGYLVGFVLPPVIDLVNVRVSNKKVKFLIAFGISFVVGLLFNLDKFDNPAQLAGALSLVFTETQLVYSQYWADSKARATLKKRL